MARIQRQELKHDEFIDTLDEVLIYVEDHWRMLVALALAVLLAGVSVGGFFWYSSRQERRAEAALGKALITFEAPVQEGLPPLPGSTQKTFASEQAKYEAAKKELVEVRTTYPRTRAALLAKHYEALCEFQLGETDTALKTLEELSRAADRNVAGLAKLHLAGYYEAQGRPADAEKLYRDLSDHPTPTVPRELAQMELADLLAPTRPAEARQIYEGLKKDFAGSPLGDEITKRLDLLPAAALAAAPPAPAPAQP